MYNNVPVKKTALSSDLTVKVFDQYYQVPVDLNNNELIAMTGFFEKRGFNRDSAESTALVILQQAKKDNYSAMQIMDTLDGISNVEISGLVAEILNFNRFKSSLIGISQLVSPAEEVTRQIIDTMPPNTKSTVVEIITTPPAPEPTYSILVPNHTINGGTLAEFIIVTENVPSGTTVYWEIPGPIGSSVESLGGVLSRPIVLESNNTLITWPTPMFKVADVDSISLTLRIDSPEGEIIAVSDNISIVYQNNGGGPPILS